MTWTAVTPPGNRWSEMTETNEAPNTDLEDILARLDASKTALVEAAQATPAKRFTAQNPEGESVKHSLERTVDELNFYYGRLVARALNLPQPPCLTKSDFGSLREAVMALQVAHRRFTNLLHDVLPDDLARIGADPELGNYTLRQILELAAAQYNMRSQQVQRIGAHAAA